MYWRRRGRAFDEGKGDSNRRALKRLVDSDRLPGVLALDGERAVGWCAAAPREDYPVLAHSRIFKPWDDRPVWSITCLFIEKDYRRQGLSTQLVKAACRLARKHGASIVEAYPHDRSDRLPDPFVHTGLASSFERAGFVEVARRSPTRPMMRRVWKR